VILIPGICMFTTGKDAAMADVSAQLYHHAMAYMKIECAHVSHDTYEKVDCLLLPKFGPN
jgi:rhamnose utilization protein RhaD (predicted bifunctional aldolase and dehydrogenase)